MPVLQRTLGDDSWLASRGAIVTVFAGVFVFPASLTKRIHGLLASNVGACGAYSVCCTRHVALITMNPATTVTLPQSLSRQCLPWCLW